MPEDPKPDPAPGDPKPDPPTDPKPDPTPDPDDELLKGAQNPDAVRNALQRERDAAKAAKKDADDLRAKVKEYDDAKKSDQEKLEERAATAEKTAAESQTKLLRFEVAAAKNIPLAQAHRLQGSTKEELEADADEFLKSLKDGGTPPNFDNGARKPAPSGSMDDMIRSRAGRA